MNDATKQMHGESVLQIAAEPASQLSIEAMAAATEALSRAEPTDASPIKAILGVCHDKRKRKRKKLLFDNEDDEKKARVGLLDLSDDVAVKSTVADELVDTGGSSSDISTTTGEAGDSTRMVQPVDIGSSSEGGSHEGRIQALSSVNNLKSVGDTEQCQLLDQDEMLFEESEAAKFKTYLSRADVENARQPRLQSKHREGHEPSAENQSKEDKQHDLSNIDKNAALHQFSLQSQEDGTNRVDEVLNESLINVNETIVDYSALANEMKSEETHVHGIVDNCKNSSKTTVQSSDMNGKPGIDEGGSPYKSQPAPDAFSSTSRDAEYGQHAPQHLMSQLQQAQAQNNQQQQAQVQHQKQQENLQHEQQQTQLPQMQSQPPGWRVKLYRLNQDGTWDDCGTGRIQFYLTKVPKDETTKSDHTKDENYHSTLQHSPPNNPQSIHQAVYRELGEPMLCMRAEIPNRLAQQSSGPDVKVLLRTRVLLHDAYQCQGGNIITWYEPFSNVQKREGKRPTSNGVDLALSFQDNAGCKDIWRHILDVQLRAKELSHFWSGRSTSPVSSNCADNEKSSSRNVNVSTQLNSIGQGHNESHIQHHNHQPLSPERTHHAHVHQPLSPHSPDHDALEDRQLSMITLPKHPPLWQGHHGHLNHSNFSQHQLRQQHLEQQNHDDEKEEAQLDDSRNGEGITSCSHFSATNNLTNHEQDGNAIERASSPSSLYLNVNSCGSDGMHSETSPSPAQLPKLPKWSDLEKIVTLCNESQMQQREDLLIVLSLSDCAYIKTLLGLFHSKPEEQLNQDALAALAVCIKSILLMNDPEIIEYVTTDEETFYSVCGVLEYTPELQEKANYREFIRERAKFRTVVKMEDNELVSYIHRLFRVNYLKDFILRPTMEESSLSTLASLAQFTQSDIIKGVIRTMPQENDPDGLGESYFGKILLVFAREIEAIRRIQCSSFETEKISNSSKSEAVDNISTTEDSAPSLSNGQSDMGPMWSQHLVPQDSSLQSRLNRRKGCLDFFKELFNMARNSLQQQEKEEFILFVVNTSVHVTDGTTDTQSFSQSEAAPSADEVNLLLLLGAILSNPSADINERSAALDILSTITLHDPSIIRKHCLEVSGASSGEKMQPLRPEPDELKQIVFLCSPNDLMQSLLLVMSTESDAGILLQTSEIIRIILDTEREQSSLDENEFMNGENQDPAINRTDVVNWDSSNESNTGRLDNSEQNAFLSLFYDRYVPWLFCPFHYKILVPRVGFPLNASSTTIVHFQQSFRQRSPALNIPLGQIPFCAIRLSFAFEILSFCVRAHVYRMKLHILRTNLLTTSLKILSQKSSSSSKSGDKCLKLASLKLFRSVLSIKDEFYHRHIIQRNLFRPVFDLFKTISIGDNLISSAILEICDFIKTENIKSLIEYIVTTYLMPIPSAAEGKSLEEIVNHCVDTFKQMREKFEENVVSTGVTNPEVERKVMDDNNVRDHDILNGTRPILNKKALEDQRKFREVDEEESYFNEDDTEEIIPTQQVSPTLA